MITPLASMMAPLGRTKIVTVIPPFPSTLSGNGLSLWIKASALATTFADNDPVGSFVESGPLGLTFTANGSSRPLWKTNILNGKPVLRFDGVDDFLVSSTTVAIQEVWAIANYATTPFPSYKGLFNGSSANWLLGSPNVTTLYTTGGQTNVLINNVSTIQFAPLTTFKAAAGHRAAVATEVVKVGEHQNFGRYWFGDIAEIVACSRVLTTSERSQLHAYFVSEYAI